MNTGADDGREMLFVMKASVKVAGYYSKILVAPPLKLDQVVLPEMQSPREVFDIRILMKRKEIISRASDRAGGTTRKHRGEGFNSQKQCVCVCVCGGGGALFEQGQECF